MNIKKPKIKKAFTLVAALVILGVVGVAAAMIIPIVQVANEKASLKEAWKQNFSEIVKAYSVEKKADEKDIGYIIENIVPEEGTELKPPTPKEGLEISNYCGSSAYVCGVYPATPIGKGKDNIYKTLSDGFLAEEDLSQNQFMLKNGANVYSRINNDGITNLWIDVNGYIKGPNRLGRDLFGVIITNGKIIPMGTAGTSEYKAGGSACDSSDTYIPIGSSGKSSNYAGASCSMTVLLENSK